VTPAASISNKLIPGGLQRFFWSRPDWWAVAICCVAWIGVVLGDWRQAKHGLGHIMTLRDELMYWLLMIAAMMLPLTLNMVRHTATRSLWARRHRAIAMFVLGYFGPWLALGAIVAVARQWAWTHDYTAAALGFLGAGLWQLTSVHRRALIACHRTYPLAPVGLRADRDCFLFGSAVGRACLVSCGPLMIACALAGHGFVTMVGGLTLSIAERGFWGRGVRAAYVGSFAFSAYYLASSLN
jgi:predicted metal-binding membrane protein